MPAALQLGPGSSDDWSYDSASQTWVFTGSETIELNAFANADGADFGNGSYAWDLEGADTQYAYLVISAAPDIGDVDGFEVSVSSDGAPLTLVTSGYGTPPLNDPNSIATHGIYDTYFEIYQFQFDPDGLTTIGDTQPGGTSTGFGYTENIEIVFGSSIEGVSSLHLDLFTVSGDGILYPDADPDVALVNAFAPFSHDAEIIVPPLQANDDMAATIEDVSLTIETSTLLGNDVYSGDGSLFISAVSGAVNGSVVLDDQGDLDPGNDEILFTPDPNFHGEASFEYTVSDGQGESATANVAVSVASVNDDPTAADDMAATDEEVPTVIAASSLLGNDTDVDGDDLFITAVSNASHGTVVLDDQGDLDLSNDLVVFTPDLNFHGDASFDYAVSDGQGGFDSASVVVSVAPVNDDPTATADHVDVAEDGETLDLWSQLLGNDSDVDGDPLQITSIDSSATLGTVIFDAASQTLLYRADHDDFDALKPGQSAETTFSYEISDGLGGLSSGQVTLTVNGVAEANKGGKIIGKRGDDWLQGGNGTELLKGGRGDDVLNGGGGRDKLIGGKGDDLFVFSTESAGDVIIDFKQGSDSLDLRGALGMTTRQDTFSYFDTNNDGAVDGSDDHSHYGRGRLTLEFDGDQVDGNAQNYVEILHTQSLYGYDFLGSDIF
ncbi:MAG: tandem-95 repeat protein [Alphaproteobacteria bacterium]|jgi:hypothetical protein|nr:tandem-95 repeat protein [Alphaproteobacteria bacterium]